MPSDGRTSDPGAACRKVLGDSGLDRFFPEVNPSRDSGRELCGLKYVHGRKAVVARSGRSGVLGAGVFHPRPSARGTDTWRRAPTGRWGPGVGDELGFLLKEDDVKEGTVISSYQQTEKMMLLYLVISGV